MPFPEDRCSSCPFAGTATVCYCQSATSPALCAHAARDPAYHAEVRRRTLGGDGVVIGPPAPAAPTRSPYVDLRPLVWECDYRGEVLIPRCGCQAEFRSCGLRKGMSPGAEHEVSMSDCLRCDRITGPSGAASLL